MRCIMPTEVEGFFGRNGFSIKSMNEFTLESK
jgi:hypothetical protein